MLVQETCGFTVVLLAVYGIPWGFYTKERAKADRIWKVSKMWEGCCDMMEAEKEAMVHFLRLWVGWTELGLSCVRYHCGLMGRLDCLSSRSNESAAG